MQEIEVRADFIKLHTQSARESKSLGIHISIPSIETIKDHECGSIIYLKDGAWEYIKETPDDILTTIERYYKN